MLKKKIIIKIGGSLLYKENLRLNAQFLAMLREWFLRNKDKYEKIVLVVGGGKLSRQMADKAKDYVRQEDDLHGIAMQATVLNSQMIKEILDEKDDDISVPKTLGQVFEYLLNDEIKVIISGGFKKGWSTDMDAAVFADTLGIDRVHKLSDIDCVYETDPREKTVEQGNKCIKNISWKQYFDKFDIVLDKTKHIANDSMPIDVIAAQYCYKKDISFFVSGGDTFDEYEKLDPILEAGSFVHP